MLSSTDSVINFIIKHNHIQLINCWGRRIYIFNDVLLQDQFIWNTSLLVGLTGIAALYSFLLHRYTKLKIICKQPVFFFLGLGLLFLCMGSPLKTISHLSFSLHMIQMSILYFVVPPILLMGIPEDLFQRIWKISMVKELSKLLIPPRIALIIFSILFLFYHLPVFLNVFSQNSVIHTVSIILLLMLSFGMWWPMVSPDPMQRVSISQKKRYAILSGALLMPACLLFIFNAVTDGINNPFLTQITAHLCLPSSSTSFEILPPPFNTKLDQIIAGFLMLGIHKLTLMGTTRFHSERLNTQEEKFVS